MKIKVVGKPELEGCKVGFYIPSINRMYTSVALAKLIADDLKLMSGLRVFRMPRRNGSDKFEDLESWILDVSSRHEIFGKENEVSE